MKIKLLMKCRINQLVPNLCELPIMVSLYRLSFVAGHLLNSASFKYNQDCKHSTKSSALGKKLSFARRTSNFCNGFKGNIEFIPVPETSISRRFLEVNDIFYNLEYRVA